GVFRQRSQLFSGSDDVVKKQDAQEAVKWYRKAAEQGDPDSQSNLGTCYETGNGVKQDKQEAVKWFRKAAEQGDPDAQCNLGRCLANGEGVQQDTQEAVKWFRQSAEQGNEKAKKALKELGAE
ncbi:MAG: sel1 repeat family protein, partial [Thermoguttaceae bacterium]|nr:sel1 repeat family protein [Thermoguttaceae bacterium]